MNTPTSLGQPRSSIRLRWFMGLAWIAILVKCALVVWAIDRWHMPFHASWIVMPTLAFAALASALWVTHRE